MTWVLRLTASSYATSSYAIDCHPLGASVYPHLSMHLLALGRLRTVNVQLHGPLPSWLAQSFWLPLSPSPGLAALPLPD